ncbi:Phosphorylase kinase, gamma catalytic subunit [Parasponia andersonii]|uniref:non-specific serine/threonine protein kinase n=1 Tax=Parasponia andersonii TaxID=3476 RepID=A0A2P5AYX9_PARAD|nr:Phosphorylase kinase, gamma catalytic subunit [Parasponia andersonii]
MSQVIEMSGVCAASDIWSVGCTVIELLTCVPPYYDLQPMPALFRIVQDVHPPIPDSLSTDITDFLKQCFKKWTGVKRPCPCVITITAAGAEATTIIVARVKSTDARQRPDAKTLLSHPWIKNCRRALQSSIRHNATLRHIQEDGVPGDAEILNGDNQSSGGSPSMEKVEIAASAMKADSMKEVSSTDVVDTTNSDQIPASDSNLVDDRTENPEDDLSDQVPTLAIHEKSSLQNGLGKVSSNREVTTSEEAELLELPQPSSHDEVLVNGDVGSPVSKMINGGKASSSSNTTRPFGFGQRNQDTSFQKVVKMSVTIGGNELSRFSDTPGDASLDDLFHPLDRHPEDQTTEASTSASASNINQGSSPINDSGKSDLATKLRATMAQKQIENDMGQENGGGGNLFSFMMGYLKDGVIDIDGLVFDEKLPGENLFPQAVEFSRLVQSLKPEESEEVIVPACQKLIAIFHRCPEQKIFFVTQHGLLPLMELLEVPKTRVICSVLQIINQIIKDNTDFQENACLVGLGFQVTAPPLVLVLPKLLYIEMCFDGITLTVDAANISQVTWQIPVVMGFAVPDRPREVRMEAAYFLQQLCQSR